MVRANIPLKLRNLLFRKVFKAATGFDSLAITTAGSN
jgi:hypothetical protein